MTMSGGIAPPVFEEVETQSGQGIAQAAARRLGLGSSAS